MDQFLKGISPNKVMKDAMKKIFFMFSLLAQLVYASDGLDTMQQLIDRSLLTFYRPYIDELDIKIEFDSEKALVLVLPGFNVKPEDYDFLMRLFASHGI